MLIFLIYFELKNCRILKISVTKSSSVINELLFLVVEGKQWL